MFLLSLNLLIHKPYVPTKHVHPTNLNYKVDLTYHEMLSIILLLHHYKKISFLFNFNKIYYKKIYTQYKQTKTTKKFK